MQEIRLAPDLSHLSAAERQAVAKLLEVGAIFQDIYEEQRHRNALTVRAALERGARARVIRPEDHARLTLYRLFQGPIATTLDNRREPFVAVEPAPPGKNVYPWDLTRAELDAYLAAHPQQRAELTDLALGGAPGRRRLAPRRPRRASPPSGARRPASRPARAARRAGAAALGRATLYAVPYSVAYADEMVRAHGLLNEAADLVQPSDAEFAGYLRNRARDLLSDDYESGDAAWVTGRFGNLNAQIGAYETYDDELLGTRAFYSLSLLATRREETAALRRGPAGAAGGRGRLAL